MYMLILDWKRIWIKFIHVTKTLLLAKRRSTKFICCSFTALSYKLNNFFNSISQNFLVIWWFPQPHCEQWTLSHQFHNFLVTSSWKARLVLRSLFAYQSLPINHDAIDVFVENMWLFARLLIITFIILAFPSCCLDTIDERDNINNVRYCFR